MAAFTLKHRQPCRLRLGPRGHHRFGGYRRLPVNAGNVLCKNPKCEYFNRPTGVDVIAAIPPVPVNGIQDFWHGYKGSDLEFYFVLCQYCRTIIVFNVAS